MRQLILLLVGLALGPALGCAPIAGKLAFQSMRGPQADATIVRGLDPDVLRGYGSIQLGEVTTDVPPICNDQVLATARKELGEALSSKSARKLFPGGDKAAKIDIGCRFFKKKGAIGGEGRFDWLVRLTDAASGEELGLVFVEGMSESPLQHGVDDMAKENAQELIKFLGKRIRGKH